MKISKRAFWDIDFEAIDWDSNQEFLIERIFARGSIDDIRSAISYYGEDKVKNIITQSESIPESVYYLSKAIFNLNSDQYKCKSITKR